MVPCATAMPHAGSPLASDASAVCLPGRASLRLLAQQPGTVNRVQLGSSADEDQSSTRGVHVV